MDQTARVQQVKKLLREDSVWVSISAVDSKLGIVQPIRQIAEIVKDYPNCRLHVDATQAVGKTELVLTDQARRIEYVRQLNRQLRAALTKYPQVKINSPESAVPHILNLSVTGVKGTVFQRALAQRGVCVSVKFACSAEGMPSKGILAVNRDRKNTLFSWHISLSHLTTPEELLIFLETFDVSYKELIP